MPACGGRGEGAPWSLFYKSSDSLHEASTFMTDALLISHWALGFNIRILLLFLIFFNIYLVLRERGRVGEGQRARETQNLKQAPGSESRHRDQHGARTHEPRDYDLS